MKYLFFKLLDLCYFVNLKQRDITGIAFDKEQRKIAYGAYIIERNNKNVQNKNRYISGFNVRQLVHVYCLLVTKLIPN